MKFRLKNWNGFSMLAVNLQPSSTDGRPRKQTVSSTSAWSTSTDSTHRFHPGRSFHPSLHLAPAPSRSCSQEEVRPGGVLQCSSGTPPPPLGQCSPCPRATAGVVPGIWDAAAHSAAFPERWKVVSQSSGWRETSNTPTGLAEIFIHLHFQICSTFSLYKYMGSSWTLGLAEPSMPLFIWWTSCFSGLFI